MLLAVDVGNTDVTFGVFDGERLAARFRFTVQVPRTSDEYGVLIAEMLGRKGISPKDIEPRQLVRINTKEKFIV